MSQYQIVPLWQRVGGTDEIVAYELWKVQTQAQPGYCVGDYIDSFDNEPDANAARDRAIAEEARTSSTTPVRHPAETWLGGA